MYSIGIGYDIHRLAEERKLFIGGVEIPYIKGLVGHSDADALLHALCDALLGAVGAGDLGEYFPDTDPQYENISSVELLKKVADLVKDKGFKINNLDTVVIAQEPNLAAFKNKIQKNLAHILGISPERINIKAKSNNGIGDIGAEDAIASFAVVSLVGEEVKC